MAQTSPSDPQSRLYATVDLAAAEWEALSTIVADAPMTETLASREERRFYRVRVIPSE